MCRKSADMQLVENLCFDHGCAPDEVYKKAQLLLRSMRYLKMPPVVPVVDHNNYGLQNSIARAIFRNTSINTTPKELSDRLSSVITGTEMIVLLQVTIAEMEKYRNGHLYAKMIDDEIRYRRNRKVGEKEAIRNYGMSRSCYYDYKKVAKIMFGYIWACTPAGSC